MYTTDKVLDSELHPIHIALREKKNGLEYYEFNYSGNILILEVNWSSVTFDQNGNSAVFVIRDVTEVKEAEAELQAHRQHLEVLVEDRTIELTQTNRKLQQEIVDRQHIEQALRTSEERFRLLIDNVKDYGIYLLDPQGYIVSWNAGAERINGYRAEEIIGQHLSCFFLPEDLEQKQPETILKAAIEGGQYQGEGWRVCKDQSRIWVNVVLTTLWDNDGQINGFSSITQNITVQRQAEEALRKSEETNRALLEAIPDFLIWMNREGNYLDVRNLDKLQLLSKDTVFTGKNV